MNSWKSPREQEYDGYLEQKFGSRGPLHLAHLASCENPYQPKVGRTAENPKRRRRKDETEDSRWQ
jgi:hypothetical protein